MFEGKYSGQAIAVSVVNNRATWIQQNMPKSLARELRALSILSDHPGVPRFYGYCLMTVEHDYEQFVFVNELCEYGDLVRFTKTDEFRGLTTRDRMMLCVDILRVLDVMHNQNIFHCRPLKVQVFLTL